MVGVWDTEHQQNNYCRMKYIYRYLWSLVIIVLFIVVSIILILFYLRGEFSYNHQDTFNTKDYKLEFIPYENYPHNNEEDSCMVIISLLTEPSKTDTLVYKKRPYPIERISPISIFVAANNRWTIVCDSVYYSITENFLTIDKLNYYEFLQNKRLNADELFFFQCDTISTYQYAMRLSKDDSYIFEYKDGFSSLYRAKYCSNRRLNNRFSRTTRHLHLLNLFSNDEFRILWKKDLEYNYAIIDDKITHKIDTVIWIGGKMYIAINNDSISVSPVQDDKFIYYGSREVVSAQRQFFGRKPIFTMDYGAVITFDAQKASYDERAKRTITFVHF